VAGVLVAVICDLKLSMPAFSKRGHMRFGSWLDALQVSGIGMCFNELAAACYACEVRSAPNTRVLC